MQEVAEEQQQVLEDKAEVEMQLHKVHNHQELLVQLIVVVVEAVQLAPAMVQQQLQQMAEVV
jgi:hypothetical protein